MDDINKLVNKIIPYPADREHRDGFSNEKIIDSLSEEERGQVETALIHKLSQQSDDLLIVTTLGYLKSHKSLDILYGLLNNAKSIAMVIIASSIYEIAKDEKMIAIALEACEPLTNWWDLTGVFYYLAKFKNQRTDDFIRKYFDHKEYLVAYNATRAMGLPTDPVVKKFREK